MDNIIKSILESYKVFGRQKENLNPKTQVIKELNMMKFQFLYIQVHPNPSPPDERDT